jgi:aminoglycoside phosphotransferase (APT) family kinase protein
MSDDAPVELDAATTFLAERFAPAAIESVEPLGGGAWSRAYGFTVEGRELVARFGRWREDYEADQRAMAWAGPDLPVPRVLEIGDAFGGAYALSERHHGRFLEDLDAESLERLLPALLALFDALRALPAPPAEAGEPNWREFLVDSLVDVPGGRVSGWRARLAADPDLDRAWTAGEAALRRLLPACPEARHVLHLDLLHGNVLVAADGRRMEAVYDWGCTTFGDFAYELAWFSFWAPAHAGLAAVDVAGAAIEHLRTTDADLDHIDERMRAYELHVALTHLAYHAFAGEDDALQWVAERMQPMLSQGHETTAS